MSIAIKFIGLILICLCSAFTGLYSAAKIKFQINDLQKISHAINLLKSEIGFGIRPLNEAAKNIALRSTGFVMKMFLEISDEVEKRKYSADKIWSAASEKILTTSYIDSDDLNLIKSFALAVSNIDKEIQIKTLDGISSELQKKISLLQDRYCREKKLSCNLGILFGLLIAIILI